MHRPRMSALLGFALLLASAFAPSARADVLLSYTGSPFTNINDPFGVLPSGLTAMSGSFLLSGDPLGANFAGAINSRVLSFSFTDGVTTISSPGFALGGGQLFQTDASGNIVLWNVGFTADFPSPQFRLVGFSICSDCELDGQPVNDLTEYQNGSFFLGEAYNDPPGVWTETVVAAPEPLTFVLLGAGLAALAGLRRSNIPQ